MHTTHTQSDDAFVVFLLAAIVAALALHARRRRLSTTAFGTASWVSERLMRAWHMLGRHGLVLGRTLSGSLLRIPRYTHVLVVGGTGSGKGVGVIIPNLLDYTRGSVVAFD